MDELENDNDEESTLPGRYKFTVEEKELLMLLVEQLSDVIENPKTDSISSLMKINAWKLIAEEYAANSFEHGITTECTAEQLKRCWENLKYRCRKADSEKKQHMLRTGGGPPLKEDPEEAHHEQVRRIMPHINFTLENPFDSTGLLEDHSDQPDDYEVEYLDEAEYLAAEADFNGQTLPKSRLTVDEQAAHLSEKTDFDVSILPNSQSAVNQRGICSSREPDFSVATLPKSQSTFDQQTACLSKTLQRNKDVSNVVRILQKKTLKRPHGPPLRDVLLSKQPLQQMSQNILNSGSLRKNTTLPKHSILGNRLEKVLDSTIRGTTVKKPKTGAEIEQDTRIEKNKEAIVQQQEIHKSKLQILERENQYWSFLEQQAKLKTDVYAEELKAMKAQASYWVAKHDALKRNVHD